MDDLQLLELLERAKEKQKGPKGDPGIGIDKVEQFDGSSFTLRLTDGSFKKIDLQPGADGEAGAVGPVGAKGDAGPGGRDGRTGATGQDGADGLPGRDGSFVDTAVVNAEGNLLLGLSTGELISCGRVVGPVGATGAQGPTGLPGADGKDGAAVLSGPRAPQQDDGFEGCFWIDISSAEFSFYKRNGEGWTKLANLRQPAKEMRVGAGAGGSSGGGGKGEPQSTRTLPLINGGSTIRKKAQAKGLPPVPGELKSQEDANLYFLECIQNGDVIVGDTVPRPPYQQGQLWFSTNPDELTLYIYDGAVWVPAAPPVSLEGIESAVAGVDALANEAMQKIGLIQMEADQSNEFIKWDQERQDAELKDLHEKVDGIAEEFDRGKWAHVTEKPTVGQYALGVKATREYCQDQYAKCVEDADGDPTKLSVCTRQMGECENEEDAGGSVYVSRWGQVDHISIHTEESDGETHGFADYTVGKYIEIINEADEGNATYLITEDAKIEDGVAIVTVSDIQATGAPNGLGRFKVFEMKSGDPTDYLQKTGGTMTGRLTLKRPHDSSNNNSLRIYGRVGGKVDQILFKDYQRKLTTDGSTPKDDYVEYHGPCDGAKSIANRDQIIKLIQEFATPKPTPTPFTWTLEKHSSANPSEGCMAWEKGKFIVLNQTTFEGVKLKKPDHLPSGANEFASYRVPNYSQITAANVARNMQIWMEYSPNMWELMAWMTPYKYRFWYKGWVQLEYTNMEGSMPDEYGKRFGVTLPELF